MTESTCIKACICPHPFCLIPQAFLRRFVLRIFFFFWMWTILKSLHWICYNTVSVYVFWPRGMWDLSSLTRDRTCTPCTGMQSLNHWTARKVSRTDFKNTSNLDDNSLLTRLPTFSLFTTIHLPHCCHIHFLAPMIFKTSLPIPRLTREKTLTSAAYPQSYLPSDHSIDFHSTNWLLLFSTQAHDFSPLITLSLEYAFLSVSRKT